MSVFQGKASTSVGTECPPAGSHPAILVAIIDLGTHPEEFKDEKTGQTKQSKARKVALVWELTGEKLAGTADWNHVISRDYTLTFGKKGKLRQTLEAWRGKAYGEGEEIDITKVLGKPCIITLKHKVSNADRTYAQIESIGPPMKGMAVPPAKHTPFMWEIGQAGGPPQQPWLPYLYNKVKGQPSSIAEIIGQSEEMKGHAPAPSTNGVPAGETTPAGTQQEIPF